MCVCVLQVILAWQRYVWQSLKYHKLLCTRWLEMKAWTFYAWCRYVQ